MEMKQQIIQALHAKYQGYKLAVQTKITNYFNNAVGVGEHPDIVAECDKLIDTLAAIDGKIQVLEDIVSSINKAADNSESSNNRK